MKTIRIILATLIVSSALHLLPPAAATPVAVEEDACTTPLGTIAFSAYLPYVGIFSTGGTNPNTGCHWTGFGLVATASCSPPPLHCRYDGLFTRV